MKGNQELLVKLNGLLAEELTAINQYVVHGEMDGDWGYERLHEKVEKRGIDEMKHAEMLIERILFLEGMPIVSELNKLHIGDSVEKQFKNDWQAEMDAINSYNEGIKLAREVGDNGTEQLLKKILSDEEEHLDWLESQQDQIEQIGISVYLGMQVKEEN
jgi:bacterioferritin